MSALTPHYDEHGRASLYIPTDEAGFIDPVDWQLAQVSDLVAAVHAALKQRAGHEAWPGVVSAWSVVSHFLEATGPSE